jgi:hypothetical protein
LANSTALIREYSKEQGAANQSSLYFSFQAISSKAATITRGNPASVGIDMYPVRKGRAAKRPTCDTNTIQVLHDRPLVRMIPFAKFCAAIQEHLEQAYHVKVVTRDIPEPLTGDLDGLEIHIDRAVSPEQRLFLLAHLFGHTVQWNVDPHAFETGRLYQSPVNEDLLATIVEYEQEAARFALAVFHQIGITVIDQWFSDYSACDLAYLRHYYLTGEKRSFRTFWRDNAHLLEPKPIPPFTPRKRVFRSDGIVI